MDNPSQQNVIQFRKLNEDGKDPQQRFVQMLGLNATSLDYFYRYAINIAKGPNASSDGFSTNFKATDNFGPIGLNDIFKEQIKDGVFAPSFYNFDEDAALMQSQGTCQLGCKEYDVFQDTGAI